jgi:hypothetical protein
MVGFLLAWSLAAFPTAKAATASGLPNSAHSHTIQSEAQAATPLATLAARSKAKRRDVILARSRAWRGDPPPYDISPSGNSNKFVAEPDERIAWVECKINLASGCDRRGCS